MKGALRSYERFLRLGHGGMAEVWLSVCKGPAGFRKLLVIKQLHTDLAEDPLFVSMFLDEARLAAELSHPNIVQTVEVGGSEDEHYIVMEYLEGQTLGAIRKHAWFPLEMELSVIRDLLRALEYAHDLRGLSGLHLGVVHRDISPDNVVVTYDGVTKLMDFGVAKAASARTRSRVGMFKGKPTYMAPEQVRGDVVDRRADIFAVGVLLWEAMCKRPLWGDATDLTILRELNRGGLPGLPEPLRQQEPELAGICTRALSVDPSARYANAREFHDALAEYMHRRGRTADGRSIGEYVSQKFSEERLRRRLAIEEELLKVRSRGTTDVPVVPLPSQRALRPISKRGSMPASLRVPAKITLRRRIVGEQAIQYEATYGSDRLPVVVEIHDDVTFEEIQGRVRSLCQAESPILQRMIDCGATLGASGVYIVRELPSGRPLAATLSDGMPFDAADSVDLIAEIARSLVFVHGRGLAHGAIDPKGIFLTEKYGMNVVKVRAVPLFVDRNCSPSDDVKRLFELLFQLLVGTSIEVEPENIPKAVRERTPELFELLYRGLGVNHPWRSAGAVLTELGRLRREELLNLSGRRPLSICVRSADLPRPLAARRSPGHPHDKAGVWVVLNDPAFRDPVIRAGLEAVERYATVTYLDEAACKRLAQEARSGELPIPSVIVFGDLDVLIQNPTLRLLRDSPEVCRLVISTHAHPEMLQETANEMGLDQQIALPCTPEDVVTAVTAALDRSGRLRRTCRELRAALIQARVESTTMAVRLSKQRSPALTIADGATSSGANYEVG